MSARLLIIQPKAFAYRRTFYTDLRDHLGGYGVDLEVVVGHSDGPREDAYDADYVHLVPDRLSVWTSDRLRWRSPSKSVRAAGEADLVLIEQAVKNLDGYAWLLGQRKRRRSVAMWGHGRTFSTHQGPALARGKQFLTRRCDWFFAYTDVGADFVVAHGFPRSRVTVVGNTLDVEAGQRHRDTVTVAQSRAFRDEQRLTEGRTALFLGGVDADKDIEYLLRAALAAERALPGFTLLVAGAGEDLWRVRDLQAAGGPVRALGRVDDAEKALVMSVSDVMMIPTWIGLVAVESFVGGVPIVTRYDQHHSPEADYLVPGVDSVWLPRDTDAQGFAAGVVALLKDSQTRERLCAQCSARADDFAMAGMVDRFCSGVLAWDEIRRFGL